MRLVYHNKRQLPDKMKPSENVLSEAELEEQKAFVADHHVRRNLAAARHLSSDQAADSDASIPDPRPEPRHRNSEPAPASSWTINSSSREVSALSLKQVREVISVADIETGPSASQRDEVAAVHLSHLIMHEYFTASKKQPACVILATDCSKGRLALRVGAHLVNHGSRVTVFAPVLGENASDIWRSNLRCLSAAGGKVVRDTEGVSFSRESGGARAHTATQTSRQRQMSSLTLSPRTWRAPSRLLRSGMALSTGHKARRGTSSPSTRRTASTMTQVRRTLQPATSRSLTEEYELHRLPSARCAACTYGCGLPRRREAESGGAQAIHARAPRRHWRLAYDLVSRRLCDYVRDAYAVWQPLLCVLQSGMILDLPPSSCRGLLRVLSGGTNAYCGSTSARWTRVCDHRVPKAAQSLTSSKRGTGELQRAVEATSS